MTHQIATTTVGDPNKKRNGDAFVYVPATKGPWVTAMVGDGVGSCPYDWLLQRMNLADWTDRRSFQTVVGMIRR